MAKPILIGLAYSPWSEKARWALDAAGIEWQSESYRPILGERRLRRLRGDGNASVPVLVLGDFVIGDSFEIAKWAARNGKDSSLLPAARERDVDHCNALAERALEAGRVRSLHRVLRDHEALLDLVPRPLRPFRPVASAISAWGVRRTLRKYGSGTATSEWAQNEIIDVLDLVRAALGGRDALRGVEQNQRYLLGAFSLADIVVAQALAFVDPPSTGLRLASASRRAFHDAELAPEYPDLIAWRDALYARHRAAARTPSPRV